MKVKGGGGEWGWRVHWFMSLLTEKRVQSGHKSGPAIVSSQQCCMFIHVPKDSIILAYLKKNIKPKSDFVKTLRTGGARNRTNCDTNTSFM
jgi:hypothetical protein